jgi:hypothetical protein
MKDEGRTRIRLKYQEYPHKTLVFLDQIEEDDDDVDGVVIDIAKINVNSEDVDQFLRTWTSKAEIIKK